MNKTRSKIEGRPIDHIGLSDIFEITHSIMLIIDPDNAEIVDANKGACEFYGWSHEELTKMKLFEINTLPPKELTNELQGVLSRKNNYLNFQHRRSDGTIADVEVYSGPIEYKEKKLIFSIIHDISIRKRLEEKLLQHSLNLEKKVEERTKSLSDQLDANARIRNDLTESEKRYREITDESNSIILEWDTEGTILYLNKFGLYFFGYKEREIIGRNVLGTIVEQVSSEGEDLQKKMRVVQVTPEEFYSSENENICKDGRKVWIAWTNKGVYNEKGQLIKTRSVGIDHTNQHKSEVALRELKENLENEVLLRTHELSQQLGFERLLNEISWNLINVPIEHLEQKISESQRMACEFLEVDLSTITERKDLRSDSILLASIYSASDPNLNIKPINVRKEIPWCYKELIFGNTVKFSSLKELPKEARKDKSFWKSLGLKSSVIIPLKVEGDTFLGAISFDMLREECIWTEMILHQMNLVANVFANALHRRFTERIVRESEARLYSIINSSKDMIWSVDSKTLGLITFNQAFSDFYQRTFNIDTKTGMTPDELLPTKDLRKLWSDLYNRALEEGGLTLEYPMESVDRIKQMTFELIKVADSVIGISVFANDITDQKKAEEKILESEIRFRTLVDQASVGITQTKMDGTYIWVNPTFCKITGFEPEDFKSITYREITHPDDLGLDNLLFDEMIAGDRENYSINKRYVRNNGEIIWVNLSVSLVRNENGEPLYTIGIIQDITNQKTTEEKLLESETRFRTLADQAAVGIGLINMEGKFLWVNPYFCELTGYSIEDFKQVTYRDITHPDDLGLDDKLFNEMVAGLRKEFLLEKRYIHKNGEIVWVNISVSLVRNNSGKPEYTIGVTQDITSQKLAEENLIESEARFRTLVNSSLAGIVIIQDGSLKYVNPAMTEIFGYESSELIGASPLLYVHPDDHKLVLERIQQRISKESLDVRYEFRGICKNGNSKEINVLGTLITYAGKPATLGYMIDISDQKLNQRKLRESLIKLEKTFEGIIQTTANIVEARDPYTSGHQKRVAEIAASIAGKLNFTQEQIQGLFFAGVIHDLGKINVPAEILSKPGKLSDLEFEMIKTHPKIGFDLLKDIEFPWPIAEIIYQHHERIDGSGYPRKLKMDKILMEAKILMVADVIEAISNHRPYRPALGLDLALNEIINYKDKLFDARVVDAVIKLYKEGYKFGIEEE